MKKAGTHTAAKTANMPKELTLAEQLQEQLAKMKLKTEAKAANGDVEERKQSIQAKSEPPPENNKAWSLAQQL